jgi:flagellin
MSLGVSSFSFSSLQRSFSSLGTGLAESIRRLSTGTRVNGARDDAAGLAISTRLSAQIRGNTQAIRNVNDMVSYMQLGDDSMSKIGDHLLRIRDLAVQAANGSLSDEDRQNLQVEVDQLTQGISMIVDGAQFNNINVLKNDAPMNIQISSDGANQLTIGALSLAGTSTTTTTTEEITETTEVPVNPVPAPQQAIDQAAAATAYMTTMNAYRRSNAQTFMNAAVNNSGMSVVSGRVRRSGSNVVFNPQTPQQTAVNDIFQAIQSTYNANIGSRNATTRMRQAAQAVVDAYVAAAQPTGGGTTTVTTTRTVTTTETTSTAALNSYDPDYSSGYLFDISSQEQAAASLSFIDSDIDQVSEMRASFGAYLTRLEGIGNNLSNAVNNLSASNSKISDADYAVEVARMSKFKMLSDTSSAMMAQANVSSKMVLNLLGNGNQQSGVLGGIGKASQTTRPLALSGG